MVKSVLDKQLLVTVNNKIGTLAEITNIIAGSGINLLAVCAYGVDNKGTIMFVSEDNKEATKLLKAKKYDVREEEVVLLTLDNKPGALQSVTKQIAALGVDVNLIYGSVDKDGKSCRLVLVSEDNGTVLMGIRMNQK